MLNRQGMAEGETNMSVNLIIFLCIMFDPAQLEFTTYSRSTASPSPGGGVGRREADKVDFVRRDSRQSVHTMKSTNKGCGCGSGCGSTTCADVHATATQPQPSDSRAVFFTHTHTLSLVSGGGGGGGGAGKQLLSIRSTSTPSNQLQMTLRHYSPPTIPPRTRADTRADMPLEDTDDLDTLNNSYCSERSFREGGDGGHPHPHPLPHTHHHPHPHTLHHPLQQEYQQQQHEYLAEDGCYNDHHQYDSQAELHGDDSAADTNDVWMHGDGEEDYHHHQQQQLQSGVVIEEHGLVEEEMEEMVEEYNHDQVHDVNGIVNQHMQDCNNDSNNNNNDGDEEEERGDETLQENINNDNQLVLDHQQLLQDYSSLLSHSQHLQQQAKIHSM